MRMRAMTFGTTAKNGRDFQKARKCQPEDSTNHE